MPLYDYLCHSCSTVVGIVKPIKQLDEEERCDKCQGVMQRLISAPMVRPDYAGYTCPITGDWIEGRRAHIENLKKHGCRVLERGEREASDKELAAADAHLESTLHQTMETEIMRLPARKKEQLAGELEAGAEAPIIRT